MHKLIVLASVLALGLAVPATAEPPAMDLQHFQPQSDRTGWFATQSAETLRLWQPSFGLWFTHAGQPLRHVMDGEVREVVVRDLQTLDLQAALGFGIADVAVDVPVHLKVSGDGLLAWDEGVQGAAMGDIRVVPKVRIMDPATRGFGLGVALPLILPSGDETRYVGMDTVAVSPTLLVTGHLGPVRLGGNVGYRITRDVPVDDLTVGSALQFAVAASVRPHRVLEIGAEVFGDVRGPGRNSPTEWLAGVTVQPVQGLSVAVAGGTGLGNGIGAPRSRLVITAGYALPPPPDSDGDGIVDKQDRCPDQPEDRDRFEDLDGCPDPDNDGDGIADAVDACPDEAENVDGWKDDDGCPEEVPDTDGDGLLDSVDACPEDPEDVDGFEDEDGCPDPDNDGDGIADGDDACPDEPEVVNNVDDEDGCPDEARVVLEREEIRILERVYFDFNRATLKHESRPLLDEVAELLIRYPHVLKVEVQGHTDELGTEDYNLELSQQRAETVMRYLVDRGVDEGRLTARGYGETAPAEAGDDEQAQALNRRVQFVILEQE